MRSIVLAIAISLTPVSMFAAGPGVTGADPVISVPLSQQFTLQKRSDVPGKTLKAGTYTITLVDHLSSRVILRVANKDGKVQTTFLGLYNTGLQASGAGPILWTNGSNGAQVLRGFVFPEGRSVEFVYPKSEAVAIAKHNSEKVLAIDPASDNLHLKHDQLSPQDMQEVTLWTLNATRIGPDNQPAIEATRYQQPLNQGPQTLASERQSAAPAPRIRRRASVQPTQEASNAHQPVIGALPHTADDLAVPLLVSLLAFAGSGVLYLRRRVYAKAS